MSILCKYSGSLNVNRVPTVFYHRLYNGDLKEDAYYIADCIAKSSAVLSGSEEIAYMDHFGINVLKGFAGLVQVNSFDC